MSNQFKTNQYREMSIKTAGRGQILIMLYEGAILNVKKATVAMDKKDIQTKGTCIGKAHDIINELLNTLDFEVGGEIALELERLYNFLIQELMQANLDNSKEKLQNASKILETLLGGWKTAVDLVNKEKTK